jgi:hypothetical protein
MKTEIKKKLMSKFNTIQRHEFRDIISDYVGEDFGHTKNTTFIKILIFINI